jgi:hypothetical protein
VSEVAQANAQQTTTTPPAIAAEPFNHQRWVDAINRSDLVTPGEKLILNATVKNADWKTGETFVSAEKIAASVNHQHATRVWDAWAKAARLGMMTRPYAKPNEGKRHYRRLLMPANWKVSPDDDGGRRKSLPQPGSET